MWCHNGSLLCLVIEENVCNMVTQKIHKKNPELCRNNSWFILHDNAPSHSALSVQNQITSHPTPPTWPVYEIFFRTLCDGRRKTTVLNFWVKTIAHSIPALNHSVQRAQTLVFSMFFELKRASNHDPERKTFLIVKFTVEIEFREGGHKLISTWSLFIKIRPARMSRVTTETEPRVPYLLSTRGWPRWTRPATKGPDSILIAGGGGAPCQIVRKVSWWIRT